MLLVEKSGGALLAGGDEEGGVGWCVNGWPGIFLYFGVLFNVASAKCLFYNFVVFKRNAFLCDYFFSIFSREDFVLQECFLIKYFVEFVVICYNFPQAFFLFSNLSLIHGF